MPEQLRAEGVTVRFGGLNALNEVGVTVERGSVTGLIGPNGAGKSTLFNVITGFITPKSGQVLLDDTDVTRLRPHQRHRLGVSRTFQRLALFNSLTVRDNVLVVAELNRKKYANKVEMNESVDATLEQLRLTEFADRQADSLPTGSARLLEVARALVSRPRYLLLDEPSAGLDNTETGRFGDTIKQVASSGVGVLLVEHDVGLVMDISTRVYVLNFGHLIAQGAPAEVKADPAVQEAYLGVPASGTELTETNPAGADR